MKLKITALVYLAPKKLLKFICPLFRKISTDLGFFQADRAADLKTKQLQFSELQAAVEIIWSNPHFIYEKMNKGPEEMKLVPKVIQWVMMESGYTKLLSSYSQSNALVTRPHSREKSPPRIHRPSLPAPSLSPTLSLTHTHTYTHRHQIWILMDL